MIKCQTMSNLSGALTPLIAVIAAYVAYQQYHTNRDKLRLDLYDRRFELYTALVDLCTSVASSGIPGSTEFGKFVQARHKTQFLFDTGVATYIEAMRLKAIQAEYLHKRLEDDQRPPVGEARTLASREHSDLMKWFGDQFDESKAQFAKCFAFK